MNQREVIKESAKLAAERGWAEGDPHEVYLFGLLSNREDARHGLLQKIRALRADLDRLERTLQPSSPTLNTLGELQQHPSAVEAAVGEFAATDKAFRDYLSGFPATEGES